MTTKSIIREMNLTELEAQSYNDKYKEIVACANGSCVNRLYLNKIIAKTTREISQIKKALTHLSDEHRIMAYKAIAIASGQIMAYKELTKR